MRIRFVTKDNLRVIRDCRNVQVPPVAIDRPIIPQRGTKIKRFRRYEFRGEIKNGVPTLNEV
jgi:hypothetical protein